MNLVQLDGFKNQLLIWIVNPFNIEDLTVYLDI